MGVCMMETGLIICNRETNRRDAYDLHSILNEYKCPEWMEHQKSCKLNEDFYNGKQWDDEEIKENRARGNYVVTINMIQRQLDFLAGQLTARKPVMIAKPVSKEYTYQCNLAQKIYDWHYSSNKCSRY